MSVLYVEMDRANQSNSVNNICGSVPNLNHQNNKQSLQSTASILQNQQQQQPQHQPQLQPQQTQLLSPSHSNVNSASSIEEQRALQLAFELSMLGLSDSLSTCNNNGLIGGNDMIINMGLNDVNSACQQSPSSLSPNGVVSGGSINSIVSNNVGLSAFSTLLPNLEERSKKSQNMTECVPVPSSEHVAEIVGRQGCKIKALRAKTNTYIKTPVRGEEPVFVVTGRKEDVSKAKREILSAAEHFSLIRASRKPSLNGSSGKGTPAGPPTNIPGQITIQVRVPYRVVGLVVGPKGATIKHIQQQTHTYIVTPSRDKEPVFEVTGQPDNVQSARRQIEAHIALRTGNTSAALGVLSNGLLSELSNSTNGLNSLLGGEDTPQLLASLYKNGLGSLFGYLDSNNQSDVFNNGSVCTNGNGKNDTSVPNTMPSSAGSSTCSSNSSTSSTSSKSAVMTLPELINIWKRNENNSIEIDEGIGDSPNIWSMQPSSIIGSNSSPAASASPTDSLLASFNCKNNGLITNGVNINSFVNMTGNNKDLIINQLNLNSKLQSNGRECIHCGDKDVSAALVPCGHNMFCIDCANRICSTGESACPVCNETVVQAIRIIA